VIVIVAALVSQPFERRRAFLFASAWTTLTKAVQLSGVGSGVGVGDGVGSGVGLGASGL
jgi:hypothetical protein